MGTDNFHHQRQARNTAKKRQEQKAVIISLEDTKSSKFYFEKLLVDKKLIGQVVIVKNIGQDPKNVLNAVIDHKQKNQKISYEKSWAIFDRDDWSSEQINGTIQRARELDICIAISNEAYELWVLLHFELLTRTTSREELNQKLNNHFKTYFRQEYSKSAQDVYGLIIGFQDQAIANAKNLVKRHIRDFGELDPEAQNPLTLVFQLVECLNSLYDVEKNCECFPHDD